MRRKTFILYLGAYILCTTVFAQEKFDNAYIVTNENDTLYGQILNGMDAYLASSIFFKNNELNNVIRSYAVSDLIGFKFQNGRTFERIDFKTTNFDTTVFAKKIVTGKYNLWVWRHSNRKTDFFLKNNTNQKIVHLTKPEDKTIYVDGKEYTQQDNRFIGNIIHVTDNEFKPSSRKYNLKYNEKRIVDQISILNEAHEEKFPISTYKEETIIKYDVKIGIPFQFAPNSTEFKLGFFIRKINVEKNVNYSIIRGITYYGWHEHGGYTGSLENGSSNHRWQLINILPIGAHYQGKNKVIKPFAYVGIGAGILAMSNYQIKEYQNTGSKIFFLPYPTVYTAAGLKLRVGSNYVTTEITPSFLISTFKMGFEF